jgi:hypothetical protein
LVVAQHIAGRDDAVTLAWRQQQQQQQRQCA